MSSPKHIDGLSNPKVYHKPAPKPKRRFAIRWQSAALILIAAFAVASVAGPRVSSLARQVELFASLTNGRYLVLFQNDAEIRASGGFIGSYAVVEAKNGTIKPIYFETNVYKSDDQFSQLVKLEPPKPLQAAIGDKGWTLHDANWAADFRQSGPTIEWFFEQQSKKLVGPKKADLDRALKGNYKVDGVIATNMTAFIDILEATGPITIPNSNHTVTHSNFFQTVQQVVEKDYFKDPANKLNNEPKSILQNLFPVAMQQVEKLPKTTQYQLLTKMLQEKKIIIYSNNAETEQTLIDQGWAGALELPVGEQAKAPADFLAVIRSSHGGNKSSIDINPIYRYSVTTTGSAPRAKLDITFEHTGTGDWPSGTNHEYLRVLAPAGATLVAADRNGVEATSEIDQGQEMVRTAYGFWLHTQAKSSQTMTLEYDLPQDAIDKKRYQLELFRQSGGNNPDLSVLVNGKSLYQGRLTRDKTIEK